MKAKYLLTIDAIVLLVFAIGYFVNAEWVLGWFDITLEPGGILMAQLFGAALLGIAVLNWLVRDVTIYEELYPVAMANFIGHAVTFIILLVQKLNGLGNVYCWVIIALAFLLSLGFGYFSFVKTTIERPTATPKHA